MENLDNLYLKFLFSDDTSRGNILKYMNEYYYIDTGKYVNIDDDAERQLLVTYVASKCRYNVLSFLIKQQISSLYSDSNGNENLFVKNNLIPIIDGIYEKLSQKLNNVLSVDLSKYPVSSYEDTVSKITDILVTIDPSNGCLLEYLTDLCCGRIVVLSENDQAEKEEIIRSVYGDSNLDRRAFVVYLTTGEKILYVDYKNDLSDFVYTIHELGHYLFPESNKDIPVMREFSSLFYEIFSINRILKNDIDDERIFIDSERIEDLNEKISILSLIRKCIKIVLENDGKITTDLLKKEVLDLMRKENIRMKRDIDNKTIHIDENNISYHIDFICDSIIDIILNCNNYGDYLFRFNHYVVGAYLAICAMEKMKEDPEILLRVFDYSLNMSSMNLYDIFVGLGVPVDDLGIKNISCQFKKRVKFNN